MTYWIRVTTENLIFKWLRMNNLLSASHRKCLIENLNLLWKFMHMLFLKTILPKTRHFAQCEDASRRIGVYPELRTRGQNQRKNQREKHERWWCKWCTSWISYKTKTRTPISSQLITYPRQGNSRVSPTY